MNYSVVRADDLLLLQFLYTFIDRFDVSFWKFFTTDDTISFKVRYIKITFNTILEYNAWLRTIVPTRILSRTRDFYEQWQKAE